MPTPHDRFLPGDVVTVDLGTPIGSEVGLRRSAVVVTAGIILRGGPNVIQVVPLTRTLRASSVEVPIRPDAENGLVAPSSAQCQQLRSVATERLVELRGQVGPVVLAEIRETLSVLMDL